MHGRCTYRYRWREVRSVLISRWLKRLMADEYGDDNAILVTNGVERTRFNAPPRDKSEVSTVGTLYGLHPIKGLDVAFDALRIARETILNLRIIAFGGAPLNKK